MSAPPPRLRRVATPRSSDGIDTTSPYDSAGIVVQAEARTAASIRLLAPDDALDDFFRHFPRTSPATRRFQGRRDDHETLRSANLRRALSSGVPLTNPAVMMREKCRHRSWKYPNDVLDVAKC